jgi:hypothetical protein
MDVSRPTHLSAYAEACLQALAQRGLGDKLSVGGGLGLLHYLDYRPTHDVDAWWDENTGPQERQAIVRAIENTLRAWGQVDVRSWGEVTSIELSQAGDTVFSFQIARRSARLEPSQRLPWVAVKLDSLSDLVASKMVALVERGAPRDFRDIHAVCRAGLLTPGECWRLWAQRQRLSDSDVDWHRARLAVETHLKRIALQRPLADIADAGQRSEAAQVRAWFREDFLDGIST